MVEMQITGKNIELIPTVRSYVVRKMGKLNRHLPNILESKVEITEEKTKAPEDRFVVQVTINSSGTILRGEERGQDLFSAIDRAADIMDRQIERFKGKLYAKGRGNSFTRSKFNREPGTPPSQIVKSKRFPVKPMSTDMAIEQMELLGHDFFLFLNTETGKLNVLYRRKDKNYGLIEPEIE